jgi:NADH:ubiquinone oxidoreductase subunit 2 (subunit N)
MDNIQDYGGLFIKDPLLTLSFALCLLSLGGIPLLSDFLWKTLFILVQMGGRSTICTLNYYAPRQTKIYMIKIA